MKLGVMADSHDNVPMVKRAVVAVFGNNDGERVGLAKVFAELGGEVHPNLAEAELGDVRIAAVHYPELARPIAASGLYQVVIYGHTHVVDVRHGTSLLLNPGETGGWLSGRATVALVDPVAGSAEILDLA